MTDPKDTPEGRAVAEKYGDILPLARPEPSPKHPRMALGNRAKIFSPFAALRGFDEELSRERRDAIARKEDSPAGEDWAGV